MFYSLGLYMLFKSSLYNIHHYKYIYIHLSIYRCSAGVIVCTLKCQSHLFDGVVVGMDKTSIRSFKSLTTVVQFLPTGTTI